MLATAIAETSLTLPDIRVVVDAGLARRARFNPRTGMSRLVTERASRAEADQRRGRAGRTAPGTCYRLWTRGEEGAMPARAPAEIEVADLAPLALELALWGGGADLAFLTPPGEGALAAARALLHDLGALDDDRITNHGRRLAGLPVHPRLGHMLVHGRGGKRAATLAALLGEPDPLRGAAPDLALRLAACEDPARFARSHAEMPDRAILDRVRAEAARLARAVGGGGRPDGAAPDPADAGRARTDGGAVRDLAPDAGGAGLSPGQLAALAYPDRIGLRRPGEEARYLLSNGKGAQLPGGPLAAERLIVATDLDGRGRDARIRQAVAITEPDLRAVLGHRIGWHEDCAWSRREGRVLARRQERLGALVLADAAWPDPPDAALVHAAAEGLRDVGLTWTDASARLRVRAMVARAGRTDLPDLPDLPDLSDAALLASAEAWLPACAGPWRTEADLRALDLGQALRFLLGPEGVRAVERAAPEHYTTPLGRRVPIDYAGGAPGIAVRVQEMFGLSRHPATGPGGTPLRLTLLSPGGRPVQVTTDLLGFWTVSYAEVRREMRGRYPRHPWPDDPTASAPTLRTKPRG